MPRRWGGGRLESVAAMDIPTRMALVTEAMVRW
jgi:hypothetical protein